MLRSPFQNRRKRSEPVDDGNDWTAAKRQRAIEKIAKMSAAEWEDLRIRLAKYAARQLQTFFHSVPAPDGKGVEDFVSDAIAKVLQSVADTTALDAAASGRSRGSSPRAMRRWDPDRYSLFGTLCNVIWSDTLNHWKALRRKDGDHHEFELEQERSVPGQKFAWRPDVPLPADILLEHEDERREWLEALAKRPLAQRIVMVMMDENVSKPAELAEILGEPPARIYKALDWLRSKISEMRKKKVA